MAGIYYFKKNSLKWDVERTYRVSTERNGEILAKIFMIAIPVTIGAAIMPIMNAIDVGIVMRRLQETGWTEEAAVGLYGQLTGMAGPLINFPQVLTQAIAMSLVPAIAAAYKQKDLAFLNYNIRLSIRTAMIIGLPCALGLMTLSEPIMLLLYPFQKASAVSAGPVLVYHGLRCYLSFHGPDPDRCPAGTWETDDPGDQLIHRRHRQSDPYLYVDGNRKH